MGAEPTAAAGLNYRLLLPMLGAAMLLQMAVPLLRVAMSYRAIELSMSPAQIGLLSSAFALLPVFFAVRIGRHNDRHDEGGTVLFGALIVVLATFGLWLWSDGFIPMLAFTCILGIGQVMSISAHQMVTTRCSGPQQHDRVLGMFLVATSCGQVLGPLLLGLATPAGALYPDESLYWMMAAATLLMLGCAILLWRGLPPKDPASETAPVNLGAIARTPGLVIIMITSSVCLATNDLMVVFFPVLGAGRGFCAAGLHADLQVVFGDLTLAERGPLSIPIGSSGQRTGNNGVDSRTAAFGEDRAKPAIAAAPNIARMDMHLTNAPTKVLRLQKLDVGA